MLELPRGPLYLLLGVGAALENVIPAVPADTFVALGGLLVETGGLSAGTIWAATWVGNVASALAMYRLAYVHGKAVFQSRVGRRLLRPHQLERMRGFYARYGTLAIFFTRFLPGLRSVVPVFAGVSHQPFLRVAVPVALASAIWYGVLLELGRLAGRNLDLLASWLSRMNTTLWIVMLVVLVPIGIWWWRTRHPPHD